METTYAYVPRYLGPAPPPRGAARICLMSGTFRVLDCRKALFTENCMFSSDFWNKCHYQHVHADWWECFMCSVTKWF